MASTLWILPAIAAQTSYAAAIITDKVVIEHRQPEPLALAVATSAVNVAVGFAILVSSGLPMVGATELLLMALTGVCLFAYLVPYFAALARDDASSVGPLFQLVTIFTLAIGWFYLGIALHGVQWIGCAAVVLGASLFAMGDGQLPSQLRGMTAGLMLISSAILAVALVMLDQVLRHAAYWPTMGVVALGIGGTGALAALPLGSNHWGTLDRLGGRGWIAVGLAEALGTAGNGLQAEAVRLGSAPLAAVMGGAEPVLLAIFAVGLSLWWPELLVERLSRRNLVVKAAGSMAVLIGLGTLARI